MAKPKHYYSLALLSFFLGVLSAVFCYIIYVNPVWGAVRIVTTGGIFIGLAAILNFNPLIHKWRWVGLVGFILNAASFILVTFVIKLPLFG